MNQQIIKSLTTAFVGAVVLFITVRIMNYWILLSLGDRTLAVWPGIVFLGSTPNYGFVFSLPLPGSIIILISLVVFCLVTWFFLHSQGKIYLLSYIFITAGAFSNFIERIRLGFVWDYFHFQFLGLHGVWNLADFLILAGILLWLAHREKPGSSVKI